MKAKHTRLAALVLAVIFALPFSFGAFTGVFLWTSPLLFLSALVSQSLSWFSLLGLAALAMSLLRKRWYCKWMCPLGVLCDAASKQSKRRALKIIPRLGLILAILILVAAVFGFPAAALLDPISILYSFFNVFQNIPFIVRMISVIALPMIIAIHFLSPHIWCGKLCPLGGLQDLLFIFKQLCRNSEQAKPMNLGRRAAIGAVGGFGLSLLFKKMNVRRAIRPPAALPDGDFQAICIRCGNCIKACPTDIIQPALRASDIAGLLAPEINFQQGYCLPGCSTCGQVCPSGAIQHFSKRDKNSLVMGIAEIRVKDCLLTQHKECDRCKFYCEYDAIAIGSLDFDFNVQPRVIASKCVGCGACVAACPVLVIRIKSVK